MSHPIFPFFLTVVSLFSFPLLSHQPPPVTVSSLSSHLAFEPEGCCGRGTTKSPSAWLGQGYLLSQKASASRAGPAAVWPSITTKTHLISLRLRHCFHLCLSELHSRHGNSLTDKGSLASRWFLDCGRTNAAQKSRCAICGSCKREAGEGKASQHCSLSSRNEQKDTGTESPTKYLSVTVLTAPANNSSGEKCGWVVFVMRLSTRDSVLIVSHTKLVICDLATCSTPLAGLPPFKPQSLVKQSPDLTLYQPKTYLTIIPSHAAQREKQSQICWVTEQTHSPRLAVAEVGTLQWRCDPLAGQMGTTGVRIPYRGYWAHTSLSGFLVFGLWCWGSLCRVSRSYSRQSRLWRACYFYYKDNKTSHPHRGRVILVLLILAKCSEIFGWMEM